MLGSRRLPWRARRIGYETFPGSFENPGLRERPFLRHTGTFPPRAFRTSAAGAFFSPIPHGLEWAFNERIVADAAFRCSIPLVAAIGHESDTTVIELVADLRAATPTQAAMRLVPSAEDLLRQIGHLDHRLLFLTRRAVEQARQHLRGLATHAAFRDPFAGTGAS